MVRNTGFILFCGFLFLTGCESAEKAALRKEEAASLNKIKENYRPGPCFLSDFNLKVNRSGKAQKARGNLRADHPEDRLRLDIKDPYIGFTLSEVIYRKGLVHVENTGQKASTMPVADLELSVALDNSIRLPFSLFRDMLFGAIPEQVFQKGKGRKVSATDFEIKLSWAGSNYRYLFSNNILKTVTLSGGQQNIQVDFNGTIHGSFPRQILIRTMQEEKTVEAMQIDFTKFRAGADCSDRYYAW